MTQKTTNVYGEELISLLHKIRINYLLPMYKVSQQKVGEEITVSSETVGRMERQSSTWTTIRNVCIYYKSFPEINKAFSEVFDILVATEILSDSTIRMMQKGNPEKPEVLFSTYQWEIYQKASQIDWKKTFQEFITAHADALKEKTKRQRNKK